VVERADAEPTAKGVRCRPAAVFPPLESAKGDRPSNGWVQAARRLAELPRGSPRAARLLGRHRRHCRPSRVITAGRARARLYRQRGKADGWSQHCHRRLPGGPPCGHRHGQCRVIVRRLSSPTSSRVASPPTGRETGVAVVTATPRSVPAIPTPMSAEPPTERTAGRPATLDCKAQIYLAGFRGAFWRNRGRSQCLRQQAQLRDLHVYLLTLHGPRHLIPRNPATYLRA